jgi:hypothetical protein
MVETLSLKILRRNHDGENHHNIEEAEEVKPRRDLNAPSNYFPWKSKAIYLRQEDDC